MSRARAEDSRGGATQEPHHLTRDDSGGAPSGMVTGRTRRDGTSRDLEDAAAVIAVITALAAHSGAPQPEAPRSVWGSPARRLGAPGPGVHTWWSSGAAR